MVFEPAQDRIWRSVKKSSNLGDGHVLVEEKVDREGAFCFGSSG